MKTMNIRNLFIVVIFLAIIIPFPIFVEAGTPAPPPGNTGVPAPPPGSTSPGNTSAPLPLTDPFGCDPPAPNTPPCFIQILQGIISRMLDIVYPILAGIVFYGGFQMMFARGEPEKYKSGLKTIKYAVIGFVVILLSQGIGFILVDLVSLGRTP